jgi:hypothetical protein
MINNNIRKLYLIRSNFYEFSYFFYHTSNNFFFNLVINKNNINYSNTNNFATANLKNTSATTVALENNNNKNIFFQKFQNNKAISIDISKYLVEELSVKLNMLRKIHINLQNAIYSSHYKDSLNNIFNHKTKFWQISTISNEISVSFVEKYFIETINIFFNHGKVIVDNLSDIYYISLSLINAKNDKFDFRNRSGAQATKLTETQIKMNEIILITYYKNFLKLGS